MSEDRSNLVPMGVDVWFINSKSVCGINCEEDDDEETEEEEREGRRELERLDVCTCVCTTSNALKEEESINNLLAGVWKLSFNEFGKKHKEDLTSTYFKSAADAPRDK